jgi:putative inorganic carbon (hco3(-)) transporter
MADPHSGILSGLNNPRDETLRRAALLLAGGSAAAIVVSVAVSQILLGAALLTLLLSRTRWRVPPVALPLAVFFAGTVIALLASPNPRAGLPQIRKFYIYLGLFAMCTTFRGAADARRLVLAWGMLAAASGAWSFVQFWLKHRQAAAEGSDFYLFYVANRVTGFMSHWMTFSAELMIAGLMLAALLLLGRERRAWWAALAVIGGGIAIAWTRSVWLGTIAGVVYLVAAWKPKWLFAAPALLAVLALVAPERVSSIWQPRGNVDSNSHRSVTFRTGIEMIKAQPLLGVGPEMVGREFERFVPADIPRPLPVGFYGHLHNFYLQYAAERGIPTALALLWLIGRALLDFVRAARGADTRSRWVFHGAIAVILAILVEGVFEHNINDAEVLTMFVAVLAMGYSSRA